MGWEKIAPAHRTHLKQLHVVQRTYPRLPLAAIHRLPARSALRCVGMVANLILALGRPFIAKWVDAI